LPPIIRANVNRESAVMTDAGSWYKFLQDYSGVASHDTVEHEEGEYVRREGDKVISTSTVEGYYSLFRRGMKGVYQHCGEKHVLLGDRAHLPAAGPESSCKAALRVYAIATSTAQSGPALVLLDRYLLNGKYVGVVEAVARSVIHFVLP
jgi:hypothetical protein